MDEQRRTEQKERLEFRGGWGMSFLPAVIFLFFCVLYFVIFKAFEMYALAMGAFVGLLAGGLFVKKGHYDRFWDAVHKGADEAVPIGILLLIIGMFAEMIKTANLSSGFVWLADSFHVKGGLFTAFTFFAVCVIATATGSSLGTMFTCFPIFYPAGILLGSSAPVLAGAIVGGAIFGDNLAPISDTTIISAGTQEYTKKPGTADVGGCVATRLKYSLTAGSISFVLFWVFGGGGTGENGGEKLLAENMDPIYKAITVGLVLGSVLGVASGILKFSDILSISDGAPAGFLTSGISGMMATVVLVLSVYGIMGVLTAAGVMDRIADGILRSRLGKTVRGAEIAMMLGISLTTLIFGGVTSASMATFGKIQNEIGKRVGLHPYRRANLLDGFANAIVLVMPFLSVFVFIGTSLTEGYDMAEPLTVTQVGGSMFYSMMLFLVLLFSVVTGWGRQYEGENGEPLNRK